MNNFDKILFKALIVLALTACNQLAFSENTSWSYNGTTGPEKWAALTPEYNECSGKNQSPVNLTNFVKAKLEDITFHYKPGGNEIFNSGHSVQVNYKSGSGIKVDGNAYKLIQFHFHAPSENQIDGVSYPMEAHLVHKDKSGNLAVVAIMFKSGKQNKALNSLWKSMPSHEGNKHSLNSLFNVKDLLPRKQEYYRFNGSLTTPPCSEGVRWIVMKSPVRASKKQIRYFKRVIKGQNNRPIQELNARVILQ